jgi:D-alanyl-lipoteichoic acid acyltransferase DltB (MBOAT superfamily)
VFGQSVRLTEYPFWLTFFGALLVLTPLTNGTARKHALAGFNVAFLFLVTGPSAAWIVAGLLASWLVLRTAASARWRRIVAVAASVISAALFCVHKLPELADTTGTGFFSRYLAIIGFSYVVLRFVEIFRYVYEQRECPPPVATLNYLLPFHMLAAGPIQSYAEFRQQPDVPPPLSREDVLSAIERVVLGLFKKLVLARLVQDLFLTTDPDGNGFYVFLEMQVFFIWLYLDFSSYSDIAVGVGRLIGVATPENFNKPYLARNMVDFWDRWHISLSQFVRRNVFIPLQLTLVRATNGKRVLLPATVAFTASFLLCGIWHEPSVRYFVWGGMHALGLVITNTYRYVLAKRLGTAGVKQYMSMPRYRVLATFLTYEYVAASLLLIR